ncbi:MAG: putative Ig domain-containing protein [Spirochaetota bacterium]
MATKIRFQFLMLLILATSCLSCLGVNISSESSLEIALLRFIWSSNSSSISVNYSTTDISLNIGNATTQIPEYTNVNSFTISPALPDGLSLDTSIGTISGTPTSTQDKTEYTITASNTNGESLSVQIFITVSTTALAISYSDSYSYSQNASVSIIPTIAGTLTSCSISPSLPSGLNLDTSSCNITGTASTVQTATTYTVTASNGSSTTTDSFYLTVNDTYNIGGTISGLSASVILTNNSSDTLSLSSDGSFQFTNTISSGSTYSVSISSQPTNQTCTVTNGSGTASANVTNISVTCEVTGGLIAHYPFTGNATDSVSGTTMTTCDSPTLTSDRHGNAAGAYSFDGNDCFTSVSNVGITGSSVRTLSFWVKFNSTSVSGTPHIANWGAGSTGGDDYKAFGAFSYSVNKMVFFGYGGGDYISSSAITTNWEHWVFVYDGAYLYLYKDGSQIDSSVSVLLNTSDSQLYVGARMDLCCDRFHIGDIDEVRVYNQALSATEVQALYTYEKP